MRRRAMRPVLERCESRELLSVTLLWGDGRGGFGTITNHNIEVHVVDVITPSDHDHDQAINAAFGLTVAGAHALGKARGPFTPPTGTL